MKQLLLIIATAGMLLTARGQVQEAEQLLLNVGKLAQLKAILENMYSGYKVVQGGYEKIKMIAAGNYSLHRAFLDGLLQVHPAIKNYGRVAEIIRYGQVIVREKQSAWTHFMASGRFTAEEVNYLKMVYDHLLQQSGKNLDDLFLVITAGKLRMSDAERLEAIDRIFSDMQDKVNFLQSFTKSTKVLSLQRAQDAAQLHRSKRIAGIN